MPETKKRTRCPNGTRKNPKTKKCEAKKKKVSKSSKKSVKRVKRVNKGGSPDVEEVEKWIIENWPHKRLPELLVSNLAGAAVHRKLSLIDYEKILLQNQKNQKDKEVIINFFKTLKSTF